MSARLADGLRRIGRAALDVLLPPQCLACDVPVDAPGHLCAACFAEAGFITAPRCAACGAPFGRAAEGGPARLCRGCVQDRPPWGEARGALRYDGLARRIILPFKYGDRPELAHGLAALMAQAGAALLREADLLVPVPLHRARLRARRYNQAALLARALGRRTGLPMLPDALRRRRATAALGELAAAARHAELAGAIAVHPARGGRIAGRRVLLIDDVLTSGATASACTLALRAAGAAGVNVLVAARV
ncbi:MAG: ComF family protein, partial [Rhodospirillales bacterium]|nr:ComF family protein [Rhodospirillales bacterium]